MPAKLHYQTDAEIFCRLMKAACANDASQQLTAAQVCNALKEATFIIAEMIGVDPSATAHESIGKLARRFQRTPYTVGQLLKKYGCPARCIAGGKQKEYPIAKFREILQIEEKRQAKHTGHL